MSGVSYTAPRHPTIELGALAYEIKPSMLYCDVTGEIDLDVSMFGGLQYSIGISLALEDGTRLDWNQDGPGNYYRSRSLIRICPRLIVDRSCFVKFTLRIPHELLPLSDSSRVMSVGVKAYALDDPFVTTQPVSASFLLLGARPRGKARY